jgi:predicted transcriptional regulator
MVFELTYLKKIRKQLGLTQNAFAKYAGISQSMVAKIESGRLDPTYSKVKQIEQAVSRLLKHHEKHAQEIMTSNVISVLPEENAEKVISIMKKHGISQVPVMKRGKVLGAIYESSFLRQDVETVPRLKAEEIMEEAPPSVSGATSFSVIRQMLQWYSCVLVADKGMVIGIVTRADVIKSLEVV